MRASWIFGAFALYETTVFADDTQYAMGGLDLPGTTYGCENGGNPSITCTDPSLNNHDCSCTCTNGITFRQPVPSPLGVNATACPSLDECQAGNMQCLEREQTLLSQLVSKQQELVDREKTLQEQLVAKQQELTNSERTLSAQLTAKQNELNNKKSYLFLSVSCRIETKNGMNTGGKPYQRLPNNSPVVCAKTCIDSVAFILGDGNGCLCMNRTMGTLEAPVAECSTRCPGDATQTCGSPTRARLYFRFPF